MTLTPDAGNGALDLTDSSGNTYYLVGSSPVQAASNKVSNHWSIGLSLDWTETPEGGDATTKKQVWDANSGVASDGAVTIEFAIAGKTEAADDTAAAGAAIVDWTEAACLAKADNQVGAAITGYVKVTWSGDTPTVKLYKEVGCTNEVTNVYTVLRGLASNQDAISTGEVKITATMTVPANS